MKPIHSEKLKGGDMGIRNILVSAILLATPLQAINSFGSGEPDIVRTEIRHAFVPKTPEQFIYDADGNLLEDGRFSYIWNGENRLVSVSDASGLVASYKYDYRGRRFSKIVKGKTTTYRWLGNNIVYEQSSSHTNSYVWSPNGKLVSASLNGTNVFYVHDANKNITDLVTPDGTVVGQYDYDSYGNLYIAEGELAKANPFRFSNEYFDLETGHISYQQRYLKTETASWMNRDPMEERGGANLYQYGFNDPIGNRDHMGLWVINREGRNLAQATAEKGDTIQSLAHTIGLDETEYKKWLTIPKKQTMPASSTDPACGTYEIPNVVYAYWAGDAGALGRAWVQWNGNVKSLESQGFLVDEDRYNHWFEKRSKHVGPPGKGHRKYYWHNSGSGTPSHSFQRGVENYSSAHTLHGVYFWGHGYTDGLYAKDGPGFNPMMNYSTLSLDYKLGLGVVFACYSDSGQLYLSSGTPGSIWQGHTGVLYPILPGAYDIKFGE